jgi:APA family basic amino acid/polyamine antiporter
VAILANSRVPYALARDGVFFAAVGQVHPRFQTPHVAILLCGGWALVLLLATRGEIGALLSGVVFADWIFFGLGAASVFALRRRMPDARRPYRAWGYPVVPGFFVVAAGFGVLSAFVAAPVTSIMGSAILVVGVAVHRWFVTRGASAPR